MSGEYNIEPIDVPDGSQVMVLSLDTTTRAGSAAVVEDRRIRHERIGDARLTHGERLPGELNRVLEEAGIALAQVELLAVAAGPGSFTGMRVGIAAMQGVAMATGLRIVPVSTLEALSRAVPVDRGRLAAWMDAQRGQVFAALYEPDGRAVEAPTVGTPAETLEAWGLGPSDAPPVRFVGDGAVRYADVIRARAGASAAVIEPPPLAGIIGLIAAAHPDRAVNPHAVAPVYIRRPDAELARLRQTGR